MARRQADQALAVPATPLRVDGPAGFDPSRIGRAIKKLTPAQRRNLLALPREPGTWATVSEMRSNGATGAGMDILYAYHGREFSERRWTRWGGERGQKRGEGYEYTITPWGNAVRTAIAMEAAKPTRREAGSARKGDSAGRKASPQ